MNKYDAAEKRTRDIEEEAKKQQTQWEDVIGIFNERFVVPFKLEAVNRLAVVLGEAPIVELGFTYYDEGDDSTKIEKDALLEILEHRRKEGALYPQRDF